LNGILAIAIVDDHREVSRGVKTYLESFPDMKVVGIATSGEEALENIHIWKPEILLLDLLMPGGIDGVETARRMKDRFPAVKVIALTASTDEARMMAVLRAGAAGYVRKDAEPEILLAAVRAVGRGKTYIDPAVAASMMRAGDGLDELSPREHDVLRQLAFGRSNKEIAEALKITDETVKTHVGHLLGKLQLENRTQAVVYALKHGIVSMEEMG
jgi:two-component system, NarL family, response regulator LiaR